MMASDGSTNIRNHGIELDQKKKRVRCNYCAKVVSGFHRLKCHLGAIKGDVVSCKEVPDEVRDFFNKQITEKKMKKSDEINESQYHLNLPLKRKSSLERDDKKNIEAGVQLNRFKDQQSFEGGCLQETSGAKTILLSGLCDNGAEDSSIAEVRNFYYKTGNNFSVIQLPRFLEMISTLSNNGQTAYNNLSCQELKECLDYALVQMHRYVDDLKETWETTGCSILLDGWMDSRDQNLVNIFVSCPKGVIYFKSSNISALVGNVDATLAFFEEVIQEVGVKNVVQIITNSTSTVMDEVRKRIMKRHAHLLWTMSASKCIELMLEKFRKVDIIKRVLKKARMILKFIHNHAATLNTFSTLTSINNLVKPSKIRSLIPYLTLENIVENKEILKNLFALPEWRISNLSTSPDGKSVSDLVKSSAFWGDASIALKASIPLLNVVHLLYEDNNPQTGYIYEAIDQAKQTIKKELKHRYLYVPFWKAIDEIWNKNLHTPLHSAGYFFNPSLFYSNCFYCDPEVASGLSCVTRMTKNSYVKALVRFQIAEYIWTKRTSSKSDMGIPTDLSPAHWWFTYGGKFPELQKIIIRILSQTCDGASKFDLKRDLAERILVNGGNPLEQQMLKDLAFVHYNVQLQNFNSNVRSMISVDENDLSKDWIFDEEW